MYGKAACPVLRGAGVQQMAGNRGTWTRSSRVRRDVHKSPTDASVFWLFEVPGLLDHFSFHTGKLEKARPHYDEHFVFKQNIGVT